MEERILKEISEIRNILTHLIGTESAPASKQFSIEALDKAAKLFKKLTNSQKGWIEEGELYKYFKGCDSSAGSFIRKEFQFSNVQKRSYYYFYNKNDIIRLTEELKSRNVDLARYIQLRDQQDQVNRQLVNSASKNRDIRVAASKRKKNYVLPDELRDITIKDFKFPSIETVKQEILKLRERLSRESFGQYIEFYGTSAHVTYDYKTRDLLPSGVNGKCHTWVNKYNRLICALDLIEKYSSPK